MKAPSYEIEVDSPATFDCLSLPLLRYNTANNKSQPDKGPTDSRWTTSWADSLISSLLQGKRGSWDAANWGGWYS